MSENIRACDADHPSICDVAKTLPLADSSADMPQSMTTPRSLQTWRSEGKQGTSLSPDPNGPVLNADGQVEQQKLSGFRALEAARKASQFEEQDEDDELNMSRSEEVGDDDTERVITASRSAPPDPRRVLAEAAVTAALTPAMLETLSGAGPLALVVAVPSTDWISPVKDVFESELFTRKWKSIARDGSERSRHKPSSGNDEVAGWLAKGRSVVGIAVTLDQLLPSTLVAAADIRLKVKLDTAAVKQTLGECFGNAAADLAEDDLTGLGFDDTIAAMRPASTVSEMVARIRAASRVRGGNLAAYDVPDLVTAVEYGAARTWGLELANDLRDYRAGIIPWSAVDRGAVFFSGPGMGKSVLARSIAKTCGVPLVAGSIGELFATSSGNLDGVIKSLRELFARATASGGILFLDEVDGLPSRDSLDSRNRDWWMPVIEDFMLLLDDATSSRREGLVVIAATNRITAVDPAIMRPGRLERAIEILPPGPDGILNILRFHVRGELADNELVDAVGILANSTAAEIMETVRSARRKARRAGHTLTIGDLLNAALPPLQLAPAALRRIAIHEAGHVVAAVANGFQVTSVQVGGRCGAGGMTNVDASTGELTTRELIEKQVVGLLAGRAAEIALLGAASVGAGGAEASDLATATRMLAAMILSYGLGDQNLIYRSSAQTAYRQLRRDAAARKHVDELMQSLQRRALELAEQHREKIAAVAEQLISHRFLNSSDIQKILNDIDSLVACATETNRISAHL